MGSVDPHIAPHFERSALLVIDTQNDFADGGASPIPGTTAIVPRLAGLVDAFRAGSRPIVHVVRLYRGEDVDRVRRGAIASGTELVAPGSPGAQLVDALRAPDHADLDPEPLLAGRVQTLGLGEVALWKPRWSAFFRTPLDDHLQSLDVDTVVIAGCNFPNCPRATAFDASERDYRTVLAFDALSGVRPGHLEEMRDIGVLAVSADDVGRAARPPRGRQPATASQRS